MATVDGGELVVRQLEQLGVRTVFTLHGSHLEPFYQACLRHEFAVIDTRHEQAAAHMADGWARHTGELAVCAITAGPGLTDAVTGVTNAFLDAVPMIVLSGRSPLLDDERLPLQSMDQMALMKPITKWQHSVQQVERIPEIVAMAYRHATSGRPGPVYLELPIDVLFREVEEVPTTEYGGPTPPAANSDQVKQLVDWLSAAERPLIVAGGGVATARASSELQRFAELTGTPVFTLARARGCIPEDHDLWGGLPVNIARLNRGENPPDLIVLIGARMGMFLGGASGAIIPHQTQIVQIDIEPEEIGRNTEIDLGITADCRVALRQLVDAASQQGSWPARPQWQSAVADARARATARFAELRTSDAEPLHPFRVLSEIADSAPRDTIFVVDGGETAEWFHPLARVATPGSYLTHGYLGCLGTGLPFALACKAASPDRPVVLITGDGAMGFNLGEVNTAVRRDLPVVIVVINDGTWGMSNHAQELMYGADGKIAVELGRAPYDAVVQAFGGSGETIRSAQEIGPAFRRALASDRVSCMNVLTDDTVIHPGTKAAVGALRSSDDGKVALPYYGRRKLA